ncbi:MAG: PilZ domain-containing protein [Acidobacteriota bacterium]|nr:MAG: PilZ domain-containing protein [Acidobacteriota bacterium]
MKNRREYQRWNCSFPCLVDKGDDRFTGHVRNLSFNGACVEVESELPLCGESLTIQIDSDPCVSLPARVVYVIEQEGLERIGIEFSGTWEDKMRLLMPLFENHFDRDD